MTVAGTAVFVSYAHADDEAEGGRIIRLSERVRSEMALLTAETPVFFVDRDSIEWGDRWRQAIDAALTEAPFLLAMITPRYFARPECRRELLSFHRQAQGNGLGELVLPILYAPVPDMSEESEDEACAIVAKTQYVDWTALRLADEASVEYRSAVNKLALRLLELMQEAATAQLHREAAVDDGGEQVADLEALLEKADLLWPEWSEVVAEDEVISGQRRAVIKTFHDRRQRLMASNAPASATLTAYQLEGKAELPLWQKTLEHARLYSSRTIELDPIVWACIKAGMEKPAMIPVLLDLQMKVSDAVRIIRESEERVKDTKAVDIDRFIGQMPFVNQTWKEIRKLVWESDALVKEANALVVAWYEALGEMIGGSDPTTTAPTKALT